MKRKEAIKAKRKELTLLNNQLIDVMADMMKLSINPKHSAFEMLTLALKGYALGNQIQLVQSHPIPSKKFKKGGVILKPNTKEEETIKVPVGSIVINPEDSERILKDGTSANGNTLLIRIQDNGTARALTWNAIYDVENELERAHDPSGFYSNIKPSTPILLSKEDIEEVEKSAKEFQLAIKERQLSELKKEIKELKKK